MSTPIPYGNPRSNIYFELGEPFRSYLIRYVSTHDIENSSGNMLSLKETCYSIVVSWVEQELNKIKQPLEKDLVL